MVVVLVREDYDACMGICVRIVNLATGSNLAATWYELWYQYKFGRCWNKTEAAWRDWNFKFTILSGLYGLQKHVQLPTQTSVPAAIVFLHNTRNNKNHNIFLLSSTNPHHIKITKCFNTIYTLQVQMIVLYPYYYTSVSTASHSLLIHLLKLNVERKNGKLQRR